MKSDPCDIDCGGDGWLTGTVECRICTNQHVGVWPAACDEDNMECPNCGHMTAEAVSYIKPDGEEIRIDGDEGEEWRGS